jgi:hypothetical protein
MNLILLAGPLDRSTGSDALSISDVDDATEIGVLLERVSVMAPAFEASQSAAWRNSSASLQTASGWHAKKTRARSATTSFR